MARLGDALDDRTGFRGPLRRAVGRLFPGAWSFLLGEVTLFSLVGLLLSGVYLALFFDPSASLAPYHGASTPYVGRTLPGAFASVLDLDARVPFGLVVRRFHHFSAHLFLASLVAHAARVYFTGAFRRPRDLTWWVGLVLLALALINGFSGYCLPFDMRGGTAIRMLMTTLGSVPWIGGWLATLAFGAPFPGPLILGRLYILHVFVGPALIVALLGAHLFLVIRLTHTDHPGPGRSERLEVGSPLWPVQTMRTTVVAFLVFGWCALMSTFFPVEAVEVYGPFQYTNAYAPLLPDWFLMWIEGAFRLLPRQLDFHLIGAHFSNPFYGAVVLPLIVFGGCALYPLVDERIYPQPLHGRHLLESPSDRPFRTAFGASGLVFLVFVSMAALDDRAASAFRADVWQVNVVWGILTLSVPPVAFAAVYLWLRRRRATTRPQTFLVPQMPARKHSS